MNARWDQFTEADYEGQIALFIRTLDEPELLDSDMAYEMLNAILQEAQTRDEWERFEVLVRALEERFPDLYDECAIYLLSSMIDWAIGRGRFDRVEPLAEQMAARAGDNIDLFNRVLDPLAYHGQLDVLVRMMRIARPGVETSDNILPIGVDEFIHTALRYEMLHYCREAASPSPDDPELMRRLEAYVTPIRREFVTRFVEGVLGKADATAEPGGETPPPEQPCSDEEASLFSRESPEGLCRCLCHEFRGYLARREGVPLTRADLATNSLADYLFRRLRGGFDDSRRLCAPGERPKRRKGKSRRKRARPVPDLCPDSRTLDPHLAGYLDFLSWRYHQVAATMESIPAWLEFLELHGLINPDEHAAALDDLAGLHATLLQVWKDYKDDPALYEGAVQAWKEPQVESHQEG